MNCVGWFSCLNLWNIACWRLHAQHKMRDTFRKISEILCHKIQFECVFCMFFLFTSQCYAISLLLFLYYLISRTTTNCNFTERKLKIKTITKHVVSQVQKNDIRIVSASGKMRKSVFQWLNESMFCWARCFKADIFHHFMSRNVNKTR